jgi:hypothetical protein
MPARDSTSPYRTIKIGQCFGLWRVIGSAVNPEADLNALRYPCRCYCGRISLVGARDLVREKSVACRSCGVKRHGRSRHRLYRIWYGIIQRCTRPTSVRWQEYGKRGIRICEAWKENYESFRDWALANGYRDGLIIDRIDGGGNYEPENCRWVNARQSSQNRRTSRWVAAFGEQKCVNEWLRDPRCVVGGSTLRQRLNLGWEPEEAITTLSGQRCLG